MSSLDAVRARARFGVTYNTMYMHRINRECVFPIIFCFTCFASLSPNALVAAKLGETQCHRGYRGRASVCAVTLSIIVHSNVVSLTFSFHRFSS